MTFDLSASAVLLNQPTKGFDMDIGNLIISRREGESFNITSDIRVTIKDIAGKRCQVCIKAPKTMPIWRSETKMEPLADA